MVKTGPAWHNNIAGTAITDSLSASAPLCCGADMLPTTGLHGSIEEVEEVAKCICDYPDGANIEERRLATGHYNGVGGFCCPHHGNTCGDHDEYN